MTSKTASKVNESDTGKPILSREALERVADLFRVFSEATRLAILQSLMSGTKSVNELVEELSATQANISKQLRVLYDAKILA
ncbi:MAG: ArsR/SmtB family transcription factor, partial [Verrucomicrobiales bacterium]